MPAQKDETAWQETEGDHADDTTYERTSKDPNAQPTDEQRTQDEIADAEQANKDAAKAAKGSK